MSPLVTIGRAIQPGALRCGKCRRVHECYRLSDGGMTWADPTDGHVYEPESWEDVAFRYGYTPMREREDFPPVVPWEPPSS